MTNQQTPNSLPGTVLVLGGYGKFGRHVCALLADDPGMKILVAGRNPNKAAVAAARLGGAAEPIALDCKAPDFATRLKRINPSILIHTAGPFQGQKYSVAEACIAARTHYIDISDGRDYVAGIGALQKAAALRDVLLVSGASSLPALSSAVVDHYLPQFLRLGAIRHGISSGAWPPGIATMRAVMSYVGKSFLRWERDRWKIVHGWQGIEARAYPQPVGKRWLANCDVPDMELFPRRYKGVSSVEFRAGLDLMSATLATWGLSWLVRGGLVANLAPYSAGLRRMAKWMRPFGTKKSAMHVELSGVDHENEARVRTWYLLADQGHGVNVPCLPAVALARKIARGEIQQRGAMPCMGLLRLDEILAVAQGLDIRTVTR